IAQRCTGALQALVDRLMTLKQTQRDFLRAESAQDLQRENDLGLARDTRVGTDEEHAKLIVLHLLLQIDGVVGALVGRQSLGLVDIGSLHALLAPERAEHLIEGHSIEPRALVIWQPSLRP